MLKQRLMALAMITFAAVGLSCAKGKPNLTATPPAYTGVNLSGAESGNKYPGVEGSDYIWPTTAQIDYFASKKMNTFRINFMWERVQPTAKGEFAPVYFGKLQTLVNYATGKGITVLLNPQNFARYYGKIVGSTEVPNAVFADFWRRLALAFKDNPRVMFGLVNEPNTMSTQQWRLAAQDAINAIRATGANNVITVPGNGWTGMHSWSQNWYDTAPTKLSNASEMIKITDPKNNFVFEVHQYLDSDFGGGYSNGECVSATIGSEKAKPFVSWLRSTNRKAILGEIGAPNTALCKTAIADLMNYLSTNSDVMVGWLWWNSIRDNFWGNPYILDITPKNGVDDPRMAWLSPFLSTSTPTPTPTTTTTATATATSTATAPVPTCCPCPIVDAGVPDTSAPTVLTARSGVYTSWTGTYGGYCSKLYIKNSSTSQKTWNHLRITMKDGSLRDFGTAKSTSVWGAKNEVVFTPGSVTTINAGSEANVAWFCANFGPTKIPAAVLGVD